MATVDWKLIDERLAQSNYAEVFAEMDKIEKDLGHLRPTYNQHKQAFMGGFAGVHFNQMVSILLNDKELRNTYPQTVPSKLDTPPQETLPDNSQVVTPPTNTPTTFKILMLTANPAGTSELDLEKEWGVMARQLTTVENIKIEVAHSINAEQLMSKTLDKKPNILHFSGHGLEDGIMLQDEQHRGATVVKAEQLDQLFSYFCVIEELPIYTVILNACHSEEQAKVINNYVKYVVGTTKAIQDAHALEFSKGFYLKLAKNAQEIEKAFEAGRTMAVMKGANKNDFVFLENPNL